MKTFGIIGGIAPGSTIVYYEEIISKYRDRVGEDRYPKIIINSINLREMLDLVEGNKMDELKALMCQGLEQLARAGANFGAFASNTPHMIFDEINKASPIPLVSIVESTANRAQILGVTKAGLFGAGFTMQRHFYAETFAKKEITVVVPNQDEQLHIHDRYMTEFVPGVFKDSTKAEFIAIAEKMRDRSGVEALILGGTELSLILGNEAEVGLPVLDTTRIHVDAIVDEMLR